MTKNWFHISSLETTIDLSQVSEIIWNNKTSSISEKPGKFYTSLFLGTSLAVSTDFGIVYNEIIVNSDEDRQALYAFFRLIPIELRLNAQVKAESVVDENNKRLVSADIPYKDDIPLFYRTPDEAPTCERVKEEIPRRINKLANPSEKRKTIEDWQKMIGTDKPA